MNWHIEYARALEICADMAEQIGALRRALTFRAESQFYFNCVKEGDEIFFVHPKTGKRRLEKICPDGQVIMQYGAWSGAWHPIKLFRFFDEESKRLSFLEREMRIRHEEGHELQDKDVAR